MRFCLNSHIWHNFCLWFWDKLQLWGNSNSDGQCGQKPFWSLLISMFYNENKQKTLPSGASWHTFNDNLTQKPTGYTHYCWSKKKSVEKLMWAPKLQASSYFMWERIVYQQSAELLCLISLSDDRVISFLESHNPYKIIRLSNAQR